jgi:hypothetical protein
VRTQEQTIYRTVFRQQYQYGTSAVCVCSRSQTLNQQPNFKPTWQEGQTIYDHSYIQWFQNHRNNKYLKKGNTLLCLFQAKRSETYCFSGMYIPASLHETRLNCKVLKAPRRDISRYLKTSEDTSVFLLVSIYFQSKYRCWWKHERFKLLRFSVLIMSQFPFI